MIHELKIWPGYFEDIVTGKKTFEVRRADRPFVEGDLLALNEWNPKTEGYTGASVLVKVIYIWRDPIYVREGFVIMSIVPCDVRLVRDGYAPYITLREGAES